MAKSIRKNSKKKTKRASLSKNSMLTAREACELLGVKAQTLYAYVSRGLLRAESHPGQSGNLYARDEVEALQARSRARAGHGPTAGGAMRWGEPILDSSITNIQGGQIYYRGLALSQLLQDSVSFEQLAELLWSGELPPHEILWTQLSCSLSDQPLPQEASASRRLIFRISRMALMDTEGTSEQLDDTLRRARTIIWEALGELFQVPVPQAEPRAIAQCLAETLNLGESTRVAKVINAALIASADHELNASTFAARVAASTGADIYASILAGLASFSGRGHGMASLEVLAFLRTYRDAANRKLHIAEHLERGRALPGFGHRLYPDGDPRVSPLLDKARTLAACLGERSQQNLALIESLLRDTRAMGCPEPNLDFALVAIAESLRLPVEGASNLFTLGRLAGWIAHIIEQRQQGFLLRPRARYNGKPPLQRESV